MGIGTSLGAYFDSPFHQQAGIETPQEIVKPKDTGDDNALPPDPGTYDQVKIMPIANITNSPNEVMDGLEGSRSYPSGFAQPEQVRSAALRLKNGETYEDINHGMALNRILDRYQQGALPEMEEGFTTSHGRFIGREAAMDMAQQRNQIKPEVLPALTSESKMLLSEDLK